MCSCYGTVLSLNGEPEPSVYVEAVTSESSSSSCRRMQEECQTEVDGSFRIRGLQVNTADLFTYSYGSVVVIIIFIVITCQVTQFIRIFLALCNT